MGKFNFTLKQWVLVRDGNEEEWCLAQFSNYSPTSSYGYTLCGGASFKCCIPFEGNEHLLGTTDDYVEPYVPQDGDFVYLRTEGNTYYITIHHYIDNDGRVYNHAEINPEAKCINLIPVNDSFLIWRNDCVAYRPATDFEKQLLLIKLEEIGKKWNADKKCIEDVWTPKDGDFVASGWEKGNRYCHWIAICREGDNDSEYYSTYAILHTSYSANSGIREPLEVKYDTCDAQDYTRPATEEEKQQLLDALHEDNKDWDAEKKEIVPYEWHPRDEITYWYVTDECDIDFNVWANDNVDRNRYESGNCFRTESEAQTMADKFKELLKQ